MANRSRRGAFRDTARLLAATVSAAALATVSGCASHPAPRPSATAAAAVRFQDADAVLTDDSTTMRQSWALFSEQQVLVQRCMVKLGYRYLLTSAGPEPAAGVTTAEVDGSGSPPGYGVTAGSAPDATPAQDRYVRGLAPAQQAKYLTAYDGPANRTVPLALPSGASATVGTGGCLGQARTELYGSVQAALASETVPQDVQQLFEHFLGSDHAYQSTIGAWQRCMAADGQHTQSPAALIGSLQALAAGGMAPRTLADRQRAAATADLACDARTGLRRTIAQQQAAFLAKQPARTLALLDQVWQTREQATARVSTPS